MTGSHQDRAARLARLTALYNALDRAGIKAMADEIGHDVFRDLHDGLWSGGKLEKDFARPDRPAQELELKILADLVDLGIDIDAIVPDLMQAIIARDSLEGSAFLRGFMGNTEPYSLYHTYSWMLNKAGPNIAPQLAREIEGLPDRLIAQGVRFEPGILPDYCFGCYGAKEFAVLLTARCDIRPVFEAPDLKGVYAGLGPNVRRLIDATGSNHGQIWLRELEPSLAAIIARDPLGSFYGLDEVTLHRELSVGNMSADRV